MISLNVNCEIVINLDFSTTGRLEKSSPDFPAIVNNDFSHFIVVLKSSFVSICISLSGNLRTISDKSFASIATFPSSITVPSTYDSIPISMSFAVSLIFPFSASIKIHERIGCVVFVDTAFDTLLIPCINFPFIHEIFILFITPFPVGLYIYLIIKVVIIVVVGVDLLKLLKPIIKYNKTHYVTMLMRLFLNVNLMEVINI